MRTPTMEELDEKFAWLDRVARTTHLVRDDCAECTRLRAAFSAIVPDLSHSVDTIALANTPEFRAIEEHAKQHAGKR